jgi:hypothetical protein
VAGYGFAYSPPFSYNTLGRTDAKGQVTSLTYDTLDPVMQRIEADIDRPVGV